MPDVKPVPKEILENASSKVWVNNNPDAVFPSDIAAYALALRGALEACVVPMDHFAKRHGGCRCGSHLQPFEPLKRARALLGEDDG